MEYLNDRTYKRGDDVRLEITVNAEQARTDEESVYEYTHALLLGVSQGFKIELRGDAPKIEGDKATIVLAGKIEHAGDDDYRAVDGVQGRVPGDTVRFERICSLDRPLKVEGGDNSNPNIILG